MSQSRTSFPFLNRDLLLYVILSSALIFAVAQWAWATPQTSPLSQQRKQVCPDTTLGETAQDCPWAGVARVLITEADAGNSKRVTGLLKVQLPELDHALQKDKRRLAWKNLWGRSINFDELANGIIVHPSIIQALGELFGSRAPMILENFKADKLKDDSGAKLLGKAEAVDPSGHQLVHAGMEHTYGYLFSVLKTSFGYKRARWVQGEIEKGFGLKEGMFSARTETGTLFSNVTYFMGRIAFRDHANKTSMLVRGAQDLAPELRNFEFSNLSPIRLEETLEAKDSTGDVRAVVLRTDLIPFAHPQTNTHLLVYSVDDPSNGGEVLITAFPVAQSFVETVIKAENLGEGKAIQTRYNAYVEGVSGHPNLKGTRKLVERSWVRSKQ